MIKRMLRMTGATQIIFLTSLVASALILLLFRETAADIVTLYPVNLPADYRFVPELALRLYLAVPLAVVAAIIVFLAPGFLLVSLLGGGERATDFIIKAFVAAYLLRFFGQAVLKLCGLEVTPAIFLGFELTMCMLLLAAAWLRRRHGTLPAVSMEGMRLVRLLLVPFPLVALLIPELAWGDFIGDAVETLFGGLSLTNHIVPRYQLDPEFYGLGLGIHAHTYGVFWFGNLFGFTELASRLPMFLYLVPISAGIVGLAELDNSRALTWIEEFAVALAVTAVLLTLGFNCSYYEYSGDFGALLNTEMLTLLAFTGILYMLWTRQHLWLLAYTIVAYFNRPTTLLVLGFLLIAAVVIRREYWSKSVLILAVSLVICLILGFFYDSFLHAVKPGAMIEGLGTESVRDRIRYLRFDDYKRFLYIIVPSGIAPFLALFLVPLQDGKTRQLSLLIVLYFSFFYVMAYYSLHHFAPVMALPIVVLWRLIVRFRANRWIPATVVTGALLAIVVAVPPNYSVPRQIRDFAREIDYRSGGGSLTFEKARQNLLAARLALDAIAQGPPGSDTGQRRSFEAASLFFYAWLAGNRGLLVAEPNYRIQSTLAAAPEGWHKVWGENAPGGRSVSAYVRDPGLWRDQISAVPSGEFASPAYRIPMTSLLRWRGIPEHVHQYDLARAPFFWRFF